MTHYYCITVNYLYSEKLEVPESVSKMKFTLHGMTSAGDIVIDCKKSDKTHIVHIYKLAEESVTAAEEFTMDEEGTMTLMPTDDFVFSDMSQYNGLTAWHLPSNVRY